MDIYSYALLLSRIKKLEEGGTSGGDASGLEIITEAPTADNPDDDLKIVVLENEPATKYEGYLYLCEKPLITFHALHWDNETLYTFYAYEGMTWQEWVNSDFNYYYDNEGNIINKYWSYNETEDGEAIVGHEFIGASANIDVNMFYIDTQYTYRDFIRGSKVHGDTTYMVRYNSFE